MIRLEARRALALPTEDAEAEIEDIQETFRHLPLGGGWQGGTMASAQGPPWRHSSPDDECRTKDYRSLWVDQWSAWFYAYTVNFAEVLYNEARGEPWGAIAAVAWTVRNRALQPLPGAWTTSGGCAGVSCDSYPGGYYSRGTCASLPCGDYNQQNCDLSRWYCCVLHGGTLAPGVDQWQFNDTHVPWLDLQATALQYAAYWVLNGRVPDMTQPGGSGGWIPPGVSGCLVGCPSPTLEGRRLSWCSNGFNIAHANPNGAMEFRSYSYTPEIFANCKQLKGFVCTPSGNYFWNRLNSTPLGKNDPHWDYSKLRGCAADPDTPWDFVNVDMWVEDPPNRGSWVFLGRAMAALDSGGACQINGRNFGRYRKFELGLPSKYRTGSWRFSFKVYDTSPHQSYPESSFEWVSVRY